MIKLYSSIKSTTKEQFSMPLSLRIIKTLSKEGIECYNLHLIDLFSIFYSIRIDIVRQYLQEKQQEKLQKRGIESIQQATGSDFDKL